MGLKQRILQDLRHQRARYPSCQRTEFLASASSVLALAHIDGTRPLLQLEATYQTAIIRSVMGDVDSASRESWRRTSKDVPASARDATCERRMIRASVRVNLCGNIFRMASASHRDAWCTSLSLYDGYVVQLPSSPYLARIRWTSSSTSCSCNSSECGFGQLRTSSMTDSNSTGMSMPRQCRRSSMRHQSWRQRCQSPLYSATWRQPCQSECPDSASTDCPQVLGHIPPGQRRCMCPATCRRVQREC